MSEPLFTPGPIAERAWKFGDLLVVEPGARIPDGCVICNGPTDGYRTVHRVFSWRPFGYRSYLWLPIVLPVSYLGERMSGQMPRIEVGLCDSHRANRDRYRVYAAVALAIAVVGLGVAFTITDMTLLVPATVVGVVGFYAFGIGLWCLLVSRQVLRQYPSAKGTVHFVGPCDAYLRPLERWPGAPRY